MKGKKITCFFIGLFLLVVLGGCQNKGGAGGVVDETGPVDEDTVIWMTDVPVFNASFEEKFNQRLQELGCDFRIDFRGVPGEEYLCYTQTGDLPDYSEADIVTLMGEYYYTSYYSDLAREGKICDLTDYLVDGVGKELYDTMPEEIWHSMEVDGKIYGLLNPNFRIHYFIVLNRAYVEKYSLDVGEGLTMEQLLQMAETIHSKENNKGMLVAGNQEYLPDTYMLNSDNWAKIAIHQQGEEWKVDLLMDLEEYQEYLKKLNQAYQNGVLVPLAEAGRDFFAWSTMGYSEEKVISEAKDTFSGDWMAVECPEWRQPLRAGGWRTVLMQASEKKEMARQILFLAYTDRTLSELLAYNAEFEEDSDRVRTDMDRSILYGNRFLIRPPESAPENYEEQIVSLFRDSEKKEWLGFWPDLREIQEEWKAVIEVQMAHEDFYYGLSEDLEAEEAAIREELKEAGLDVVLEELNRQAKEFQQSR